MKQKSSFHNDVRVRRTHLFFILCFYGTYSSNTALERGKKIGPVKKMTKLSPEQGCRTTVEAAVGDLHKDTMYLQPYQCPIKGSQYPPFEIRGVYQGPTAKTPILPADEGRRAAAALFEACQELTGATWE
jgi:hypothetical protein